MSIVPKHFLSNPNEQKGKLPGRYVDLFIISEELDLVDYYLCNLLSKEINSNVYWYTSGKTSVVCVMEEYLEPAIEAGKKIIIQNFNSMSAEYLVDDRRLSVLIEYSIIATFTTCSEEELSVLCNKVDESLLIKTNLKGEKCVLTKSYGKNIPEVETTERKHCNTFLTI